MKHRSYLKLNLYDPITKEENDSIVHDWYKTVFGFSPELVRSIISAFGIKLRKEIILDPFCGTGTTMVEAKKHKIHSLGIDTNPPFSLSSQIKLFWDLDIDYIEENRIQLLKEYESLKESIPKLSINDDISPLFDSYPLTRIFKRFNMVNRWISPRPLVKLLCMKKVIEHAGLSHNYKNFFLLGLTSLMIKEMSNVKFGPEVYCISPKEDANLSHLFTIKSDNMISDLKIVKKIIPHSQIFSESFLGDSRKLDLLSVNLPSEIDYIITSPPYPAEHDYTRNTRLELIFLGFIETRKNLQTYKKSMLRADSKGIYVEDNDSELVIDFPSVQKIISNLIPKVKKKTYGFAKQYPRVIGEYFGGMLRHFETLLPIMRKKGKCAYIVGERRTYLQTYVPTAKILGEIAHSVGFKVKMISTYRVYKGTTGSGKKIKEQILFLEAP